MNSVIMLPSFYINEQRGRREDSRGQRAKKEERKGILGRTRVSALANRWGTSASDYS
jgi:hypothetical protein